MKLKKPRVLTVDDGQPYMPQYRKTAEYGFIFSSDIKDWWRGKNSKKRKNGILYKNKQK